MKLKPYARILIEGMDGSGKSTLLKQLEDYLGDNAKFIPGYNRIDGPKSGMPTWWMEQLAHNPVDKMVVHDRFFYSELVYGPILRNQTIGRSEHKYVLEFLRNYAFLIYCRPPLETIIEGFKIHPQPEVIATRFHDLLLAYDKLMLSEAPSYGGRFVRYDWTDDQAL